MKKEQSMYRALGKRLLDVSLGFLILVFSFPIWLVIMTLIKFGSPGPVIFGQKRVGKNGKIFKIYKFRTMVDGAEKLKNKFTHLNEAEGPVFKMKNDPRFIGPGQRLAKIGLDELPQLINVLRGEMSLTGPRPLPIEEERLLKKWQKKRNKVRPGLTSSWVVNGARHDNFDNWMKMDLEDIRNSSPIYDLGLIIKTAINIWDWTELS